MYTSEHLYAIALRRCNQIGDVSFKKLMKAFGSAENVWKENKALIKSITGINKNAVSEIGNAQHLYFAERELEFCSKNEIKIYLRHLKELPFFLNDCIDAPAILYQKGNLNPNAFPISMVGTRNATSYGKEFITDFLSKLSDQRVITISGLAHGIDTEVHKISLENQIPTIGILAHGLHMLYPTANKKLAQSIIENNGALLTEFNSTQKPDREHFLQRNRIIAGLSRHLIIVETAFGGGSINTASFGNIYNRDVYALPGKITDKFSQGCNQLIFQNKASAISTINDLIDNLGLQKNGIIEELFPEPELQKNLNQDQQLIYNCIVENNHISLDDLVEKTEYLPHQILPILLELELFKLIKSFSGRQFSKI